MRDDQLQYFINATPDFDNGEITVTTQTQFNESQTSITQWVVKTQDIAVRRALVALGWTPPQE